MSELYLAPQINETSARANVSERRQSILALLPIMAVVSIAFLITAFALPVLPLHVHHGLGLSTFVVRLVTGRQFAASVLSRVWAGRFGDRGRPIPPVLAGLGAAVARGR